MFLIDFGLKHAQEQQKLSRGSKTLPTHTHTHHWLMLVSFCHFTWSTLSHCLFQWVGSQTPCKLIIMTIRKHLIWLYFNGSVEKGVRKLYNCIYLIIIFIHIVYSPENNYVFTLTMSELIVNGQNKQRIAFQQSNEQGGEDYFKNVFRYWLPVKNCIQ